VPFRRQNRYLSFLILMSMVVAGFAIKYSTNKEGMAAVIAILGLLLRQEYADRKARQSRQSINVKLDDIKTTAAESAAKVETTAEEVKQAAEVVVHQTNGSLDAKIVVAVRDALNERLPLVCVDAIKPIAERLEKLDQYVHRMKHDLTGKIHADLWQKELAARGIKPDSAEPKTGE
jgi:uncharacterized membrane protein